MKKRLEMRGKFAMLIDSYENKCLTFVETIDERTGKEVAIICAYINDEPFPIAQILEGDPFKYLLTPNNASIQRSLEIIENLKMYKGMKQKLIDFLRSSTDIKGKEEEIRKTKIKLWELLLNSGDITDHDSALMQLLSYNEFKRGVPSKLIFQKGSNTIRQMPENYLIAHFLDNSWRCEPDLAADKHLCMKVFEELLNFESKYNPNGDEIINKIEL